jgi:hypothetical protein
VEAGRRYTESRDRITALVAGLPGSQLGCAVPAMPGRTVRDVVEHLLGVAADVTGHRLGHAGDVGDVDLRTSLERWAAMGPVIESSADSSVEVGDRLVEDIACHEHDLRGALGQVGERDSATVDHARQTAVCRLHARLESGDVAGLRLLAGETEWIVGSTDPAATLTTDPFTLFRLLFGRRSRGQLRALSWTNDPEPYVGLLSQSPPLLVDLVE